MRHFVMTLFALSMLSCADQHNSFQNLKDQNYQPFGERMFLSSSQTLQVVDAAGVPIGNAEILLGNDVGDPFGGNVLTSDQNGLAEIPADWKTVLPVTISAKGYVTRTIPFMLPEPRTIRLSPQEGANDFEMSGDATDFGRLITDGKVDFALVMPTLNRSQLLNFDMSTMISPEFDTITIVGNDVQLPSNISLPDQTENYIFPIRFNKPKFRNIVRDSGNYQFFASRGQFPIRKVADDIRAGKSIFEVVNHFTFLGGGYKTANINGDLSGQDIAINQVTFDSSVNVQAPKFGTDKLTFSLSLSEENAQMTPFDLKRLASGTVTALKALANKGLPYVISLMIPNSPAFNRPAIELDTVWPTLKPLIVNPLATQDFSQLSFNIEPVNGTVNPTFIEHINKPTIVADQIKMTVPTIPANLTPVATFAVLSEIETLGTGELKSERRTRLWEMMSLGWVSSFDLPKLVISQKPNRTYRWEVMFLASPTSSTAPIGADEELDLSQITHVSRNATNL